MPNQRQLQQQVRLYTAVLLVCAVLFAQWVGLAHRIEHSALGQDDTVLSILKSDGKGALDKSVSHSCKAFDAAALGAALLNTTSAVALLTYAQVRETGATDSSWNAVFFSHFHSRAPPLG